MKYYLNYDKNNNIVGYSNCPNISSDFECREVTESEYNEHIKTLDKKQDILNELNDLRAWFESDYTKQEQKLRRLHTLELKTDDGLSAYDELMKLYVLAEEKRKEIQRLEKLI